MKKVLIVGSGGMLGNALTKAFTVYEVTAWDLEDLDVTNREQVFKKIGNLKPDVVINATGYTDVDGAETEKKIAMAVNGHAVGFLAEACKDIDALLIHYSSDYVFDGKKEDGYIESDQVNPISVYGQSKLLGEKLLQEKCDKYYLIRSSWLFGKTGRKNFVEKILKKAAETGNLKVVNDVFGRPTYVVDLAEKTKELIESNLAFGIYHLTNNTDLKGVTWYDLANAAIQIKGIKAKIETCSSSEFIQPAARPKHSVLINNKATPLRDWRLALKDCLND